jgi:predicted RNA binding protein YcfA (HicA-like mRNA interferase family)
MIRLPMVLPKEVIAILQRKGFFIDHQTGSHVILRHLITERRTMVAVHPGDLPRSTMKKIMKQAGLSEDVFRELL